MEEFGRALQTASLIVGFNMLCVSDAFFFFFLNWYILPGVWRNWRKMSIFVGIYFIADDTTDEN